MSRRLTPERTRTAWSMMCARFGTRVVPKESAPEMRATAGVLWVAGVMAREVFMRDYTTVWGRRIYTPFALGEGDHEACWSQLVVCAHEHQHVVQYARVGGFARYAPGYVLSARKRALWEAEAYGCNLELNWWMHGVIADPARLAAKLERYGCGAEDVAAAQRALRARADRLERGEEPELEATRALIEVLTELDVAPVRAQS